MADDPAKLVSVSLSFLGIKAEWKADPTERQAAWELYVELSTRVATQPLGADEGLLREALNSLYALFDTTRQILRKAGPTVGAREKSVGGIAVQVLNKRLRPVLAKWHPELEHHESKRPEKMSLREHERAWEHHDALRAELEQIREDMDEYAVALAKIAGV